MAAFTEADIRRFIREEVTSQSVRDTIAYAVDYLMDPKASARADEAAARLLNTQMFDYATLPNGYRPTVGEVINGAKTADAQLAALTAVVEELSRKLGSCTGPAA